MANESTPPPFVQTNPWFIAAAVMLATFMEVLDTSIAAVALPYIAGSVSATNDEATWVLTSYLVANAIVLPASGWFARKFGRRNFLVICIVIFTVSSFACGAATSLPMLLVARAVQGAGGGALQPLSQAILLESFPAEKRGQAMAAFGFGVVVAPVLGPTLGRLDHGELQLAVGVLHQYPDRDSGGDLDFAAGGGPEIYSRGGGGEA